VTWHKRTALLFGKYRGSQLGDVPSSYLTWLREHAQNIDDGLRNAIDAELASRKPLPAARIDIKQWFRTLSLEYHPDRQGGSAVAMRAIERGRQLLEQMLTGGDR
jgi:hypothetical protein